ncbi:MAG: TetR/AcrR family transcriptional regulator [Candidatus Acididesulfobacter guangdongensis]|uniref:TetR/AcrR family transcriptional regulator n=1 Tax=Acididesulfobacter guangdongensis TaxID=2597225 RepID=A0A519BFL3_ACIG2|nr:MAG: TetR/AcrR family transcriptional regulator [Candidatus Acididesulfobacter guangdongensis]
MRTNEERSASTREEILRKAMKLFVARGYHNTSIRDIAKESKISTGAIYHHFNSKEEIAVELFNSTVLFLSNLFNKIIDSEETTKNKIKDLIYNLLKIAKDDKVILEYALNVKHKEFIKDGKSICSSEPFETLRTFLKNEMEKGNIRKMDTYISAVCLTGIPVRLIQIKWDNVITKPLDEYKNEVFECVWNALKIDNS